MVNVLPRGVRVVGFLPQPPGPPIRAGPRAVDRFQYREQIAADLDGAGHVGLTEIERSIPSPTKQGRTVFEQDSADGGVRHRRHLKAVPQHEPNRRRFDGPLDPRQRQAIEPCRRGRRHVVGTCGRRQGPKALRLHFGSGGLGVPRIPGAHATTASTAPRQSPRPLAPRIMASLRVMVSLLQRRKRVRKGNAKHLRSCVTLSQPQAGADANAISLAAAAGPFRQGTSCGRAE